MTTQNVLTVLGAIGIFGYLFRIHKTQKRIMSKQDLMNDLLRRLDSATNEIAKDLETLLEREKDNISDESLSSFGGIVTRLETMGKDTLPEPTEEPTEEEPTEEPTPGEDIPGTDQDGNPSDGTITGEETTED